MVEKLGSSYPNLITSHLCWVVLSGAIIVGAAVIGVSAGPSLEDRTLLQLFSTLTTALASVLAISFSVLFISTQIASERYSPRFTVSFVNDIVVKLFFGFGILCILCNVLVITLSPTIYGFWSIEPATSGSYLFWGLGGLIISLNLVFLILLYPFIRLILIQTTPENILSQFRRQLSYSQYLRESIEADKVSNHPMQPVYEFSRNSIRREDYSAAISAIDALFSIPQDVLKDLSKAEDSVPESIFSPLFSKYENSLLRQSDSVEFDDAIDSIIDGIISFGKSAVSLGQERIFQEVYSAAYSHFEERDQYRPYTQRSVIKCCSKLFSSTASDFSLLVEYIPSISSLLTHIKANGDPSRFHYPVEEISRAHNDCLPSETSESVDVYEEKVLLGIEKQKQAWEKNESPSPLLSCTYLLMQATAEIMEVTTSESPPGFLYEGWDTVVTGTNPSKSPIHLQHLFRRYIELLLYSEEHYEIGLSASTRILGIVTNNGNRRAALAACKSIMNETRSRSDMSNLWFLEDELTETWSPISLLNFFQKDIDKVKEIHEKLLSH